MRLTSQFRTVSSFLLKTGLILAAAPVFGQPQTPDPQDRFGRVYPARVYQTRRFQSPPPVIDGRLDDTCWAEGEWQGDFLMQIPTENAPPTAKTEMNILYDDDNVYFAFRAFDDPALVHRFVSRRDEMSGDIVGICFDSYGSKRQGFEFDLSAGGSKVDLVLMNAERDCQWDMNWDAVWEGKVGTEDSAWTAEFRIPLSQLRYGPQKEQVWGMHAWRWIDRNQEEDQWNLIPRNNSGRFYHIGELRGITGLKRSRRVEILPYGLGRIDALPKVHGDPFRNGADASGDLGLDAKIGLTTDITLDATFNPDFGQVEADPSVMNLSAFETFYSEKRPFFMEGRNLMTFDAGGDGGMLFYSRRVGHAPTYTPFMPGGGYVKMPENATILNAVKVTGKTADGLSLGVLQSVTQRETARIALPGPESGEDRIAVEPLTNYFMARLKKDWDKGNTSLGGVATSVNRSITDPHLRFLPRASQTGGLEFGRWFANRNYLAEARVFASRLSGEAESILRAQTGAVHYYQRPDADHVQVDSLAESLSGHGGTVSFGRVGNSKFRYKEWFYWYSPGLDLNDIGWLQQADVLSNNISVEYVQSDPGKILRSWSAYFGQWNNWDFGGLSTNDGTGGSFDGAFNNRWGFHTGLNHLRPYADTRMLRGGPAFRMPGLLCVSASLSSDGGRPFSARISDHAHFFGDGVSELHEPSAGLSWRVADRVALSADFSHSRNIQDLQYATVSADAASGEPVYVLGRIDQKTLSTTFRVNWYATPDFSVQFYGSPFISTGRYTDFKRVQSPLAVSEKNRFRNIGPDEIERSGETGEYRVAESGGPAYAFGNPDFSFREFRSNLVLRWEYRPGSVLYAVWSQGRTSWTGEWERSTPDNLDALWSADSENVFLVKASYWFTL
jgi:hypothetical protein